jgi:hypothetical protein
MVSLPTWARYWLVGLGLAWLLVGWIGGGAFWLMVVAVMGVWGVFVGRRYANVTLQPWSKERGIVIWGYRRKQAPTVIPRLVWDEEEPAATALDEPLPVVSETRAEPAPPATPPAASEVLHARPLPFPARSPTAGPVPTDTGQKTCPDCAETVLSAARVCRYCGYRFEPPSD